MEQILLGIAGSIIILLIGALAYFVSRYFSKQDEALKEQREINHELNQSIIRLNGMLSGINAQWMVMNEKIENIKANCKKNHP